MTRWKIINHKTHAHTHNIYFKVFCCAKLINKQSANLICKFGRLKQRETENIDKVISQPCIWLNCAQV